MQPFFFAGHTTALYTYEFWISDDITVVIKILLYIILLPFAKLFCFFCHIFLLYAEGKRFSLG